MLSITYIGPPHCRLLSFASLTDIYISAYFVIMPINANRSIQKTAPGPPTHIADATPTMLPIPIVLPKAMDIALKPSGFLLYKLPNGALYDIPRSFKDVKPAFDGK